MKEHIVKKKDRKEDIREEKAAERAGKGLKDDKSLEKKGTFKEGEAGGKPIHWFHINQKYMSVCRYSLFVIVAAILIYIIISHWGETKKSISNLFNVLSPFLVGVLMAYFLIPLVARIQGILKKITKGKYEKITKSVAIFLAYLLVIGFIAVAFVFVIPQMGQSVQELTDKIPYMYRTIMRASPVMVQILIIYYVIFASIDINKILVAIISFGLNSAAYVAEVVRSGIMAVDEGQFEAGRSLGMTYRMTMIHIIMPQAIKNILPALGNEFIVLLKETSISGYIGLSDLTRGGVIIQSITYEALLPLLAVALIYLVLVLLLSAGVNRLERRMRNNER